MNSLKLTFLGSGTSHGVPMIACNCPVCKSTDAKDKRLRASVWLHDDTRSIIIDAGPDFRTQTLRAGISRVDALLLTHTHADHINGLDEMRVFSKIAQKNIPLYAAQEHLDVIRRHFEYIFADDSFSLGWGIPRLSLQSADAPFELLELQITPIPMIHGNGHSTGYRIGDFAYLTDCSELPASSIELLKGVRTAVIDGLRWEPHPTHFSISQALEALRPIAPEKIYLTHICHNVSHADTSTKLPQNAFLAYDGLEIEI